MTPTDDDAFADDSEALPAQIGRYEIRDRLGLGATAAVYRGYDIGLQREVAVKVPRPHLVSSKKTASAFLSEARTLASLEHPNIMPIYDLGRTEDGLCFLVCKLFEQHSLKDRLRDEKPAIDEAIELTRCLAEALEHAHQHGLVHRDVKPGNILLDADGRPVLADFDLALHPCDFGAGPTFVGTVAYMSPEQARREGHRVDARTDVYGLGVVLYEMLTGRRPFEADNRGDLIEQIKTREPVSPRDINADVPAELARICLKALAKLPAQRYATAQAMADDLRHLQMAAHAPAEAAGQPIAPAAVVPRGLSAFTERDAGFFPALLGGPYDRVGLPDAIRFWKERLDSIDPESTFRVGLLLGPTGSGKSSLLRAGVLPRLASSVQALRIECTPGDTETTLADKLRRHCADLPEEAGLAEVIGSLRLRDVDAAARGKKIVIVLDQFEQWLNGRSEYADTELVAGLRQCDGVHVQAVLLVRDDFSLAASRFLHELEVPIVEGVNFATVDRFTPGHARKVLTAFGRAYGALPPAPADLTPPQQAFVDQAVAELTEDDQVVPVRLVLLAETLKARPWTPDTLRAIGGAVGSAVAFLEDALGQHAVNPAHRRFHAAACHTLQALLPARGGRLKGVKRSRGELEQASGFSERPDDFRRLIELLAHELRLISPVESDDDDDRAHQQETIHGYYQLTHDYLVTPLRQWLTQHQRATPRGRALLRLAEFSDDWNALRERSRLPGPLVWASIVTRTRHGDWTPPQRRMLRAATRHHLLRAGLLLTALVLIGLGWRLARQRQDAELADLNAADLVSQLRTAPLRNVPAIIAQLAKNWDESEPRLHAALRDTDAHPRQRRNLQLALLRSDPGLVTPLSKDLLQAQPEELLVLRESLQPYRAELSTECWQIVEQAKPRDRTMLRAAGALVVFDHESPRWAGVGDKVADALLQQEALELTDWVKVFHAQREDLLAPLSRLFHVADSERERRLAAVVLADFASAKPNLLTELILEADPQQYAALWRAFQPHGAEVLDRLEEEVERPADAGGDEDKQGRAARRRAQAAVLLLQLGRPHPVWPLLQRRPDPSVRSWLIHLLAALKTDAGLLADRLAVEKDRAAREALILCLGDLDGLAAARKQALAADWLKLYRDDADPGLHAAIDWTLRQRWGHADELRAIDASLAGKPRGARRWFVNKQRQTFVVIPKDAELPKEEDRPGLRIPRSFAVSLKNVTVADFGRFQDQHPAYRYPDFPARYIDGVESPMIWLTWFDAAAYCRWLSEQEGLPEEEMCYPPLDRIKPGMKMPANYLQRTGYRLPTEAEWQYAARAGTSTPRFFGHGQGLVGQYGWYFRYAGAHVHGVGSLKPNALGLFDIYGNTWEWSQDRAWRKAAEFDREDTMLTVPGELARLVLGGCFTDQAFALTSSSFVPRKPGECHTSYGFRLARTLR